MRCNGPTASGNLYRPLTRKFPEESPALSVSTQIFLVLFKFAEILGQV